MTTDERRIAKHLLDEIGSGLRPDATEARAAHTLLTKLVGTTHGAASHAPRRKRLRAPATPAESE
jgi:hypothetical protein